ncbi:MAG: tetratricopeptide repeat protein [Burkholderiales bacterium]|nr:tetratricopeptide repeat protein [Burkholderiales bacterium]
MSIVRYAIAIIAGVALAACASAPREPGTPLDTQYFADARFAPPAVRIDAADVFALSPPMRAYLEGEIEPRVGKRGRQLALLDALYTQGALKLDYDTAVTRNAAEAFAARSGNCLSLVIMTAAFAKALDLPVTYQKVLVDDVWARSGDLYLAIGHVNLTMGRRRTDEGGFGYRVGKKAFESEAMTVDFLPAVDLLRMRSYPLDEGVIVAMYMNNRAVEALAAGRVDDAYWWAREAIVQADDFLVAYNTLGAVYRRHGDLDRAEAVLRFVLAREPRNPQVLANLVTVLEAAGKLTEARAVAVALAQIEPDPPFAHLRRGIAALQAGDARGARDWLLLELTRAPDDPEVHSWLAMAYLRLGDGASARAHLALAVTNSTTQPEHDLYAAKLAMIDRAR